MKFVDHVPDHLVTDLVYRHLPSWHAVACYFDWRRHYALKVMSEQATKAANSVAGRNLRKGGAVLTAEGWVLPTGRFNPRIIDAETNALIEDIERQVRIDAEVDNVRVDHETAVLAEDLAIFGMQWHAVFEGRKGAGRALRALREVDGHSEQREAYMVRWHGDHPH